jgi:hypothetical protein
MIIANIKTLITLLIIIVVGSSQFIFGIYEAYYLDKYSNINFKDNNCSYIHSSVLTGCICDIICGLGSICLITFCVKNLSDIMANLARLQSIQIIYVILNALVYQYSDDSDSHDNICYDFVVNNAPIFWIFIQIHYIFVGTSFAILVLSCVCFVLYESCKK